MKTTIELEEEVKRLEKSLRFASMEIHRLKKVIEEHTSQSSRILTASYKEPDVITSLEDGKMTTRVRTEPLTFEAVLVEPLAGWTDDHKVAFTDQVRKGFSAFAAELIAASIWRA